VKPFLGDQLNRDKEDDCEIDWSPDHEEPRLNCWLEVECQTPDGDETINYMYVDGAYLRDHLFDDFVEGGHFYRYGWVPEGQIWIEDILSIIDQMCTGVHEIHERFKMKYMGWDYERGHESARKIERALRTLTLDKDTIIPHATDIAKIFAMEGSGKNCLKLAEDLFHQGENLADEAEEQSNNPVGKEGD